jgi:coronin-1B/1C/6
MADAACVLGLTSASQVNPEYLSVNWESSGGGAFAVIPLNERGKVPDQIPLFRGHTAAVLDTDWYELLPPLLDEAH